MNTPRPPAKKNVFISYRVSDTSGETGRLVDALKTHFEEDQIFMDIDKIEPGVDFAEVISRSLDICDVMLAIIGPNWQGKDANGMSRIKKGDDWVRLELSTALKRNIRVVPVLVDGATLPDITELPEDLEGLTRRQTYEISNKRWRYDTEQLMQFLYQTIGVKPKRVTPYQQPPVAPGKSGMSIGLKIGIGIFAFFGVLILIGLIVGDQKPANVTQNPAVAQPAIGNTGTTQTEPIAEQPAAQNMNVNGSWVDPEGGVIALQQSGNKLTIQVYHNEQQTGTGSGYIEGSHVEMSINMLNVAMVTLDLHVTEDGRQMNGSLTAVAEGKTNTINTILTRSAE